MTTANWAGNYTYRAGTIHRPTSVEDVQELVAAADHIKALGSRHSFNDVADSSGDQISLEAMPVELVIDRDSHTATVNAGVRYGAFAEELHRAGFAVHNLASLQLVTADGSLVTVRRGETDFDGAVVSLGALGVVTRVTLDVAPTFDVR